MKKVIVGATWLLTLGLYDLGVWSAVYIRKYSKPIMHSALCGIAGLLTWMSFIAADFSRLVSLTVVGCALALFVIGLKPIASSRLLTSNYD